MVKKIFGNQKEARGLLSGDLRTLPGAAAGSPAGHGDSLPTWGRNPGGIMSLTASICIDSIDEMHDLLLRLVKGLNLISPKPLPGTIFHAGPHLSAPGSGTPGPPEPVRGDALRGLPGRVPLDHPELTGGKANALGQSSSACTCRCRRGLSSPPGPTGASWSTITWKSGSTRWLEAWARRRDGRTSKPPARSSTASWPGWSPRKWPGRSGARRKRAEAFWAVRSSAYGEDGEVSFAGLHESSAQCSRPRILLEAYKRCWPASFPPKP